MDFISVRGLVKEYPLGRTTVHALRGVDLDIRRGEYICVVGPSGAGKSTFLNILGLLDEATGGELHFDGVSIPTLDDRARHRFRRERIAFIFQSFNLVPVLNAYENIEFSLLIQKVKTAERRQRILDLAEEVGIPGIFASGPTSFPADRGRGWQLPARWSRGPRWSWRTSPRRIWTPRTGRRFCSS